MSLRFHRGLSPCLRRISFSILALLLVWGILALGERAKADNGGALVVATCGVLPLVFAVGSTRSLTVNTSGQICN